MQKVLTKQRKRKTAPYMARGTKGRSTAKPKTAVSVSATPAPVTPSAAPTPQASSAPALTFGSLEEAEAAVDRARAEKEAAAEQAEAAAKRARAPKLVRSKLDEALAYLNDEDGAVAHIFDAESLNDPADLFAAVSSIRCARTLIREALETLPEVQP